ncbi:MAG TPA: hypothetical protein PKY85_09340 [Nitrosomonas sp.]|nr:hypothetical protein [Nitrosomonas sp.]
MAKKKARVILSCTIEGVDLEPNTLISADESLLEQAEKDGAIDTSAAAVKYCAKEFGGAALAIEKYKEPEPEKEAGDAE